LLLHAATGFGAIQWYANVERLAASRHVLAIDFIGAPGRGMQTAALLIRADCADWLIDIQNELGIQRSVVIGSSHGGWLG
jgi:pimeloyl-ACP methyl ester carboxylesterase